MLAAASVLAAAAAGLAVDGDHLTFGGSPVFLSGANQPWLNYGADFGNNRPSDEDLCTLRDQYLLPVQAAGGHTMRFWLFVEGSGGIPSWDSNGMVNGTDAAGTLVADMKRYMDLAASMDILIVWCLWNGAVLRDQRTLGMITSDSPATIQSFIDNCLTPLATALHGHPALGGWEIMNEPEGSVLNNAGDSEPCFDTVLLKNSGAGWAQQGGTPIKMKDLQRFVAMQAAAIHASSPGSLVTVGSWNAIANTDSSTGRNYWKDECLAKSVQGVTTKGSTALDFYQIHSYPANGGFDAFSPFSGQNKAWYGLNKPVVVGEFPAAYLNGGITDTQMFEYAYAADFDGAWGWALNGDNTTANIVPAMASIKTQKGVSIKLNAPTPKTTCGPLPSPTKYPPQPKPGCTDIPPAPGTYSCEQQAGWGKCNADFMKGFCCSTCFKCAGILQCGGAGGASSGPLAPGNSTAARWNGAHFLGFSP